MPSNWLTVEGEVPTFTGKESTKELGIKFQNYMSQLTQQLRYSLQNLGKDNWNTKALQDLGGEITGDIALQVRTLGSQLSRMQTTVNGLLTYIRDLSELSGRIDEAEIQFSYMEQELGLMHERVLLLETYLIEIDSLLSVIKVAEDGATIGQVDRDLRLVGNVYINGVLYTGGTE